ncbi:unnamed protein product [Prunus armeniaca]|uniref:Uncharacterized protein n=1 Tax=Prunus armeniaca TaxID=36596 RepID=A0A6J5TJS3_PRUAR|nr:unnamed protein product [Prunus armeniaca]
MGKHSSLGSASEATVFIDTSLGTHLAVTVSHHDTVSAFKRRIEYEHQSCFTSMGNFTVEALKVKRKGCFYHLSDSMLVKNAFSGVNKNWFLYADASDVPRKRLSNFKDSIPLLLEGNERAKEKVTTADQNGSVDFARETSQNLEIGVKHSDNDHCTTSVRETINRPEREIQEDHRLCSEGYRVPTTQERKEDGSRKESDVQRNVSLEKASPSVKKGQCKTKQRKKETVHLKENDASVHGFGKEQSHADSIPPEISPGNQSRDFSCNMTNENKNATEEPCRSSASTMDNRSDSRIHGTNDTSKETEGPGKHIKSRKNTSVEEASQSQPAAKKKRKFESISGLEDSLKENNVLICDSNNETSKPDIASEFSLLDKQKNANAILDGVTAESSDLLTNSSSRNKKKRKKSSSSLNQVIPAAPSERDVMEEKSKVAAAGINDKNSGGEDDIASVNEQELRENDEVPSSLDVNNITDAGNVESKSVTAQEKLDGHPPLLVKVPSEGGTDWPERVGEERESSHRKDSVLATAEKHKLPSQDKRDRNDPNVIVTSQLLDANGSVTPSKKQRKTRKTKGSTGETQIKSGSEHGISLDGPHEVVHGDHASDKTKEGESNLSQKNVKDVSEKETESSHFVRKTDKPDGNEVETLEQIGKPQENAESMNQNMKNKSKRKQSATTKNLLNLQAEGENVGILDPALTTDNKTEVVDNTCRNSKLEKTTPVKQSNGNAVESDKDYGIETDLIPARSNSMSIESKVPSLSLEHVPNGRPLEANVTGNPPANGCSNEGDNDMEVSCDGNTVNFDKHLVPSQRQHGVVASGEMHAEEVTGTNRVDNKPKDKKKRKKLDVHSSGPFSDLQSPLKSNENQGIGGKTVACNSSSIQPQGSLSKGDDVMPQHEKKVPKKVPKTGTKAPSSDVSGKMNSVSEAARKHSVAMVSGTNTRARKKKEVSSVSNPNLKKLSNKADQNKMGNKRQSGVNRTRVAGGKASGIDHGEVVNSLQNKKLSAIPRTIFKDDSSGSSEDEDEVDVSQASTQTPSDYSSSSSYSDGESNADMSSPRSGNASVIKSCSTSGIKDLKWTELAKSSSTFKKAKFTASQSPPEDDEIVPDSQPIS